jgi:hypothetical protein
MPNDEQFGVVRIKLLQEGCSAVVAELRAADQLVVKWSDSKGRALDFEMTFDDGCSVHGRYEYERSKTRRPSLSRFMRETFKSLREDPPRWPNGLQFLAVPTADPSRYVIEGA